MNNDYIRTSVQCHRIREKCLPIIFIIYLGFLTALNRCENILAIVPLSSRSHSIVMQPLFIELARKGHNVTVVSPFPLNKPMDNYIHIDVAHVIPTFTGAFTIDFAKENLQSLRKLYPVMWDIGWNLCEKMFKDNTFQNLLNSTYKYDLIITELFVTDCFLAFAHKWDLPAITIATTIASPWTSDRIGNPDNPSYIPHYFSTYTEKMSFFERLLNTINLLYSKIDYRYSTDKSHHEIVKKYFGESLPPLEQIARQRTSLLLVNSYFSFHQPRPMVPNFIEIGGIHLQQSEPLPQEIQNLLDKSINGFIYFSMGSLFRGASIHQDKIEAFLNVFTTLPQLVLWKFEDELPYTPPNVIINKWWPQNDILAHKNIKIFITHGGLASTYEAVNAGVPVLGIPIFADQPSNINNIVRRGGGIQLNYDDITSESLSDALNTLINNRSYMENANKISKQFKDRPFSVLDNAVFWVEYVLRHNGAYHMRSATTDLPLYQYLLLDIAAFVLLTSVVTIYIFYKAIRMLYYLIISKNANKSKNTSKKTQ